MTQPCAEHNRLLNEYDYALQSWTGAEASLSAVEDKYELYIAHVQVCHICLEILGYTSSAV